MVNYDIRDLDQKVGYSEMTLGQMITDFRQAKNRRQQLEIFQDTTGLKPDEIKKLLTSHGVNPQEFPRKSPSKLPKLREDPEPAVTQEQPVPQGMNAAPADYVPPKTAMKPEKPNPAVVLIEELVAKRDRLERELEEVRKQIIQIVALVTKYTDNTEGEESK